MLQECLLLYKKKLARTYKPISKEDSIWHLIWIIQLQHLVDSRAHTALQYHLQHLGVCRVLVCGKGQLLCLLLHVLNGHLYGNKNDLGKKTQQQEMTLLLKAIHPPIEPLLLQNRPPPCGWRWSASLCKGTRGMLWGLFCACTARSARHALARPEWREYSTWSYAGCSSCQNRWLFPLAHMCQRMAQRRWSGGRPEEVHMLIRAITHNWALWLRYET